MGSSEAARVEAIARDEIGTSEEWRPGGWSNRVKYTIGTRWFGQPWCVWFAVWVARKAGIGPDRLPTIGSCRQLQAWAKRNGRWDPWPHRYPAVVLINARPGSRTPVHAGLAISATGTEVHTIEGNAARPGQSQGSIVATAVRARSRVVGSVYFGRL